MLELVGKATNFRMKLSSFYLERKQKYDYKAYSMIYICFLEVVLYTVD